MRRDILFVILAAAGAAPLCAAPHTVAQGEHMWGLAERYYKDSGRWRVIAGANAQVKDPHWIYPGQVLEIPDLPPAAVEASASFQAVPREEPAAVPMKAAELYVEPKPAPEAAKSRKKETTSADALGLQDASGDGLTQDMAPAMTGYYFSQPRLKISPDWRKNGVVVGEDESLATAGESIAARFDSRLGAVKEGARFTIYRQSGVRDTDADKNAVYIQRIGVAEVSERLVEGVHKLIIVKSVEPVQSGDWLKEEKK